MNEPWQRADYPQQQQQATLANPYARQQQLAALVANQASLGGLTGASPALEARQQQFQAHQQQQASVLGARTGPAGAAGYAAQRGAPPAATPTQQRRPAAAPAAASAAPAHDDTLMTDVLDVLAPRQLAIYRYARQHDLVAPVFDAWTARDIEAGLSRRREMLEVLGTVGVSRTTGEPRNGVVVPGFGKDGALGQFANGAARIATRAALEVPPEKAALPADERRRKLEQLLRDTEYRIEKMEQRHDERMGRAVAPESPTAQIQA